MKMRGPQQPTKMKSGLPKLLSRINGSFRFAGYALMIFAVVLCVPELVSAQQQPAPLSLGQAVKIALEKNPQRKAALADTSAAAAYVSEARSFLLPHATFSETATRGNDPVYVFGSRLRQQRFAAADFALNSLNTPPPIGNFATQFGGTWNLFDSLANWRGVVRAQRVKDAAGNQLERTDQQIVFQIIDSYYSVLLGEKQLDVAEQALKTAQAILEQSKNRYESGIVVKSDLLSAQVRMATRQQELIGAQNDLALAQAQLSISMGLPAETKFDLTGTLAEKTLPAVSMEEAEKQALETRPDLKQIRSEESAQHQNVLIAKSSFGPRVSAFGDWEADNPTFLAGGGGNNWLAGIEVQFDLFQGGAKRAQLAHERAMQDKVAAAKDMANDAVRLEVRRAYYQMDAAQRQLEVARAAIAESQESLRINQNRYDSGLSTISDLLVAEEAARRSQTDYWNAIYRYQTSYANLQLATGTLNPQSPVVTP
ncbi:MAG TPA: TolC family protein [Candidatus Acidoferrales bacterium]|nr:TolC family protein [Candidatus Acidoferrales bacterium]